MFLPFFGDVFFVGSISFRDGVPLDAIVEALFFVDVFVLVVGHDELYFGVVLAFNRICCEYCDAFGEFLENRRRSLTFVMSLRHYFSQGITGHIATVGHQH